MYSKVKILTIFFLFLLVFIIISADLGQMPAFFAALYNYPHGDKLGHFLLMGSFSFLVNVSLDGRKIKPGGPETLLGSWVVAGLVTIEEFSQLFIQSRSFSFVDLACDFLGIWLFGAFAARLFENLKAQKELKL